MEIALTVHKHENEKNNQNKNTLTNRNNNCTVGRYVLWSILNNKRTTQRNINVRKIKSQLYLIPKLEI